MRTSAITAAFLGLTTLATVSAQDDFAALLADLSFSDSPSLNEHLAVAEEEPAEDLKPLPSGFAMPGMLESTPPAAAQNASEVASQSKTEVATEAVVEVAPKAVVEAAPKVALQDPIPATVVEPADRVDFDAIFGLQEVPTVKTEVVGHIHNRCDSPNCDPVIICTPHVAPNLPSSTLMQYFRSNRCNTHVWDGYRQHCYNNKHLTGDCDCFKKGNKHFGCHSSNCGCDACAGCDSGCAR